MGIIDGLTSFLGNPLSYSPFTLPISLGQQAYSYYTTPSPAAVADSAMLTQQAASWDQAYTEGRTVAPLVAPTTNNYPGSSYYTVKSGDTLSKIAAMYGTTYQQIMTWNNLKGTTIFPGDRLLIRSASAESSFLTQQASALDNAYAQGKTVLTASPSSGQYGPVGASAVASGSGLDSLEKYLPWAVGGLLVYKLFLSKKGGKGRRS